MAYSLLAHLYPHIKGSQEDIATLSLQYLLAQSEVLNKAFTRLVANSMHVTLPESLQYSCQVVGSGENKERPDMAGFDSNGTELLLCEMKFYASLTENQPNTYLSRLRENGGTGLTFICPAARRTSLWAKITDLCKSATINIVNDFCISVDGVFLSILTWTEIIETLKETAASMAISCMPDIAQLEGYCAQLDNEAFIPFSADDLSAKTAQKAERYYDIVDEVIELLHADKSFITSKKGLKATGYRKGYTRSICIDEYAITLNYDRDLWKDPTTIETPFWVAIRNADWKQSKTILERLNRYPEHYKQSFWSNIFLALEPLQNATFNEVCEDLKKKIMAYLNELTK